MKNMKKNGFTLMEVLGVVIILGVIGILIIPKVVNTIRESKKNSYNVSAKELVEAFNGYVLDLKATLTPFEGCFYDFESNVTTCNNFVFKGKKPDSGKITIDLEGVISGTIVFGDSSFIVENNIAYSSDEYVLPVGTEYVFDYRGNEETFTVPSDGYYKLEVWGAQGGDASDTYIGGYGGYSTGSVYLERGSVIYINVGGQGNRNNIDNMEGGYNGGGGTYETRSDTYEGTGGGATHMALSSGLLSSLSNVKNNILIVAGGGGGASYYTGGGYSGSGGSGGGYQGVDGGRSDNYQYWGKGGTQIAGGEAAVYGSYNIPEVNGLFGQGAVNSGTVSKTWGQPGGGAGYYGGGLGQHSGSGGGSGYIGNTSLINKSMYCYNCTESNDLSTKTVSTTNVSDKAVSQYSKKGNGYAKITYVGKEIPVSREYVFDYTGSEETFDVPVEGYYKLEVWGAQGGNGHNAVDSGGYGGYSTGIVYFGKNDKLFINVGGVGTASDGGYNGGGSGTKRAGTILNAGGGGGGATHIATSTGQLNSLSGNISSILIVAGGGGGGTETGNRRGGSGGGINGNAGQGGEFIGGGGTQNSGGAAGDTDSNAGSFGLGGSTANGSSSSETYGVGGGGGGYYGGGASSHKSGGGESASSSGGGGSGYIGNSSLLRKIMYCYNCTESNDVSTKTISTTNVSSQAVSQYAKIGNGYAKITYLGAS